MWSIHERCLNLRGSKKKYESKRCFLYIGLKRKPRKAQIKRKWADFRAKFRFAKIFVFAKRTVKKLWRNLIKIIFIKNYRFREKFRINFRIFVSAKIFASIFREKIFFICVTFRKLFSGNLFFAKVGLKRKFSFQPYFYGTYRIAEANKNLCNTDSDRGFGTGTLIFIRVH
jgi:hypothetical protein